LSLVLQIFEVTANFQAETVLLTMADAPENAPTDAADAPEVPVAAAVPVAVDVLADMAAELGTEFGPKERKEWTDYYTTEDGMYNYIAAMLEQQDGSSAKNQEKFTRVLADLAIASNAEDGFRELHGRKYRWLLQTETELPQDEGKVASDTVAESFVEHIKKEEEVKYALPDGWRWLLQLNSKPEGESPKWWDWLLIKKSHLSSAHLGLFAARDFPRKSVLGFYIGPVVWQCARAGTEQPSDEYLTSVGIQVSPYMLTYKDGEAKWRTIDPLPVAAGSGQPLYMGMHYMNNACKTYLEGTKEFEDSRRLQNTLMIDDGMVYATKKIRKGSELLTGYTNDERMERMEYEEDEEDEEDDDRKPAAKPMKKGKKRMKLVGKKGGSAGGKVNKNKKKKQK